MVQLLGSNEGLEQSKDSVEAASGGGNPRNATIGDSDDDALAEHLPKTNGSDVARLYSDLEVAVGVGR
jgi:hypothetical protein